MDVFEIVLASVPLAILAIAGTGHALAFSDFVGNLQRQRLLRLNASLVAGTVVLAELALGVSGSALIVLGLVDGPTAATLMSATGVLYASFAVYATVLLKARPGAPCGCGRRPTPVTGWVVARAAVLAGCSMAAATTVGSVGRVDAVAALVGATASLVIALLLWVLPDAMARSAA